MDKTEARLSLLKAHSHAFGHQHPPIQDWSKTALKKLSDIIVLYWFTIHSDAHRNRLILFSIRLQVRENINLYLQKTEHRSLMLCFTLVWLQTVQSKIKEQEDKLKIQALRNRTTFFPPSFFYWKTINIGWTPLDVLCPEPLNTKCYSSYASKRIFCHKLSFSKASSPSACCQHIHASLFCDEYCSSPSQCS